jgi:L-ascorbate metabolism protein UlaG (beta-lactamase superfamily)
MDINWYGHSCFRLRGRDVSVVTDPYGPSAGFGALKASATVVTVSHDHPNHNYAKAVPDARKVVTGPGEYEIGGLMITGVATAPLQLADGSRLKNTAYVIQVDEVTVCHLGAISTVLTSDEIDQLKDTDVLLLPVGGHGTITTAQASQIVSQLEPGMIIPMRYSSDSNEIELDAAEAFCKEMGLESPTPQPRISVTKSGLPDEPTVTLLEPRKP